MIIFIISIILIGLFFILSNKQKTKKNNKVVTEQETKKNNKVVNEQETKKNNKVVTEQETIQFNVETLTTQTEEDRIEYAKWVKKSPKWYGEGKTKGLCFESERIEPLPKGETELVIYKTDRYADLFGRGKDCSYFPGYGEIYNRAFDIWFQELNSQEKKEIREYKDIGCDKYKAPFFAEKFTNGISISNPLERTKGYLKLYNGRDDKNKRTWYAGLKNLEFTGLITDGESDDEQDS